MRAQCVAFCATVIDCSQQRRRASLLEKSVLQKREVGAMEAVPLIRDGDLGGEQRRSPRFSPAGQLLPARCRLRIGISQLNTSMTRHIAVLAEKAKLKKTTLFLRCVFLRDVFLCRTEVQDKTRGTRSCASRFAS